MPINDSHHVDHHHCNFSYWCKGQGKENYGHLSEFNAIEDVHIKVHQLGADIIQLCESGNIEQARTLCADLLDMKAQIFMRINALQNAVAKVQKKSTLSV